MRPATSCPQVFLLPGAPGSWALGPGLEPCSKPAGAAFSFYQKNMSSTSENFAPPILYLSYEDF